MNKKARAVTTRYVNEIKENNQENCHENNLGDMHGLHQGER